MIHKNGEQAIHVLWTTQQTSMVHASIHFAHQSISHGTRETFILHTKVYHHGRVDFGIYKSRASSVVCHSCVIFHIVLPWEKLEARDAQIVSTAHYLCYRNKRSV